MFQKGWRQREQNGRDKLADQQEKWADPEFQATRAASQQLIWDQEAAHRAEQERLRLEREGPVRSVAELFRERFRDDLPEIVDVLSKPAGVTKLLPHLKRMAAEAMKVRRDAAEAARLADEQARMEAEAEQRVAALAEDRTKRKARQAQAEAEAAPAEEAAA